MHGPSPTFFAIALLSILSVLPASAEVPGHVMPFLDQHCFECHDPDVSKGGLNLFDLAFNPSDPANFSTWQRVFERVRDGEMPPEDKTRPEAKQVASFLTGLGNPLLEADRKDVARNGRVRARQLTRVEYEHTLHDLLGIDLPLRELLPEDPESHGFETVAEAQQLSHHRLARYLDVADLALAEAFARALSGDTAFQKTFTPQKLSSPTGGNYRGPEFREDKSISWPIQLQFSGRMPVTKVPADGWYQVTLRGVHAINPGPSGAVWGTLRSGETYSNAPVLYMAGLVEATPKPRDLTFQAWIREGHGLELKPNDGQLRNAPTGATGGNISYKGRDLIADGFAGIAHRGIEIERIYPHGDAARVREVLFGNEGLEAWKAKPRQAVDTLVNRFAEHAFRRPVDPQTIEPYRAIARDALADGDSLPEALRAAYQAILCSPRFLSFVDEPGELDDFALASRLSYALWVSMPDARLLDLAAQGKLRRPPVLLQEVDRLLDHPKAERFVQSFTDQWLKLKQIDFTSPDRRQFPDFDPVLQESMLQETRAYVAELIRGNLGVDHLVDSKFAFLNGRLARHYDIDASLKPGAGIQKVSLPAEVAGIRGGLVSQGSILKVTADGTTTSPIIRGVFINERILGAHVPPPPPNVPAIEPDIRGAVSIRDQLDKHRSNPSCISCHLTIDPPGFALENFDPAGGWRENYGIGQKGKPIDPSGITTDGEPFTGIDTWKAIYAARGDQLSRGFAAQFLTYATGASIRFSDAESLDAIVARVASDDYGVRSLLKSAISSPIFLRK